MEMPVTLIRAVVACSLIAAATPSGAEPANAQAEVLFREGRRLMAADKIAEACTAFEQSQKIAPAVTTLLNLAGCREKLGQLATAWGLFLEAEQQTRSASNDAVAQLHKIARERAAKLEPRISKLTISVPDESKIDRLEILRDREIVSAVNRALPVDGGTYTITARADGVGEWSTRVEIASEADAKTVEIPDLRTLRRKSEEEPRPVTITAGTGRGGRLLPISVVSAGAALAIAGGILYTLDEDDVPNDPAVEYYTDTAPISVALMVSGAVVIGVGVYLLASRSRRNSGPAVGLASGSGVIGWTGRF
jgi:hypothetical protein